MTSTTTRGTPQLPPSIEQATGKRNLPPDPEGENGTRATLAQAALREFEKVSGCDKQDAVADLLCNLMHLCDRDRELGTFSAQIDRAYKCYGEETATDQEYAKTR